MKIGDLCWLFEGCKKTLEEPVIYMGAITGGLDSRPYYHLAVLQSDGKRRTFPAHFYTFVRVEDDHVL